MQPLHIKKGDYEIDAHRETASFATPPVRLLAPLALHCSLHSRAPSRSHVHSLAHSLLSYIFVQFSKCPESMWHLRSSHLPLSSAATSVSRAPLITAKSLPKLPLKATKSSPLESVPRSRFHHGSTLNDASRDNFPSFGSNTSLTNRAAAHSDPDLSKTAQGTTDSIKSFTDGGTRISEVTLENPIRCLVIT